MKKLNDADLQGYLDGSAGEEARNVVDRVLQEDPGSRQHLSAYRHLYHHLNQAPAMALGPDFADRVMSRIQPHSANRENWTDFLLVAVCAMVGVGVLAFFTDLSFLQDFSTRLSGSLSGMEKNMRGIFYFRGSGELVPLAGVVLLLAALFDRMLLNRRH